MLTRWIVIGGLTAAWIADAGPAYAYIDPGMGSMLLQGIVGGAATFLVVVRLYGAQAKRRILATFGRSPGKSEEYNDTGE